MVLDLDRYEMTRTERLLDMMIYLDEVRETTVQRLCERYGRSRSVVYGDLLTLETLFNVPFVEKTGKCVRVISDWRIFGKVYS